MDLQQPDADEYGELGFPDDSSGKAESENGNSGQDIDEEVQSEDQSPVKPTFFYPPPMPPAPIKSPSASQDGVPAPIKSSSVSQDGVPAAESVTEEEGIEMGVELGDPTPEPEYDETKINAAAELGLQERTKMPIHKSGTRKRKVGDTLFDASPGCASSEDSADQEAVDS